MLLHRVERLAQRCEKPLGMRAVVTLPPELLHDRHLSRNEYLAQYHVAAGESKSGFTCRLFRQMLRDHEAGPGFLAHQSQYHVYSIIALDAISGAPHSR